MAIDANESPCYIISVILINQLIIHWIDRWLAINEYNNIQIFQSVNGKYIHDGRYLVDNLVRYLDIAFNYTYFVSLHQINDYKILIWKKHHYVYTVLYAFFLIIYY